VLERLQQRALGGDAHLHALLRGQRVAPTGLLVAVEQRLLVGVEEEHVMAHSQPVEIVEDGLQGLEVLAPAHIGDHRGALHLGALVDEELGQAADHLRGQVVHAEVAGVLEDIHRRRLARAGEAGDDHQVLQP